MCDVSKIRVNSTNSEAADGKISRKSRQRGNGHTSHGIQLHKPRSRHLRSNYSTLFRGVYSKADL